MGESTRKRCLGHPFSAERRQRHSQALIGHPVSQSTRLKLSIAMKRRPRPSGMDRTGRKWSSESRQQWSKAQKGVKRKPHTIESRLLMSKIAKSKRPVVCVDESRSTRKGCEWKLWREAVFRRDNYTCQKCGRAGGRLHPHHIENFARRIDLRFSVTNGATLCVQCHTDFHRLFGKKGNNLGQFQDFITTMGNGQ